MKLDEWVEIEDGFWSRYSRKELTEHKIMYYRANKILRKNGVNIPAATKWRLIRKAAVYTQYGNKCACCGETEELFLTIDHVKNNGATDRKANAKRSSGMLYSHIIKQNFPADYQLLCRNCNWGKHANGGTCPHKDIADV